MPRRLPAGFLREERSSDDDRWLPPPRRDCSIEPLIDACAAYEAMEQALIEATASIWLAHWSLDTDFATQSRAARDAHLPDWTSLLTDAVERGLEVRVIFNDFDPLVGYGWHLETWQAYRHLMKAAGEAASANAAFDRARFQVIVSMHDARLELPLIGIAANFQIDEAVDDLNGWTTANNIESARQAFEFLPRLWRYVAFDPGASIPFSRARSAAQDPVHVGSHHQKLCIIDRRVAFLGGIDIGGVLVSNGRHEAAPYRHDVHFRVTGAVVADLVRAFRGRWNREGRAALDFVRDANAVAPAAPLPISRYSAIAKDVPPVFRTGRAIAQMIRTVTGPIAQPPAPEAVRLDTEACVMRALQAAEKFVYIEHQYLRWPVLADWLIDARSKSPELRVIVLVPFVLEEAGDPADTDPVTLHGMHLQHQTLKRLSDAFGPQAGLFTLGARVRYEDPPRVLKSCRSIVEAA
ncbi:MAG: hypothetical protein M3461_21260 [Pseudomonadota bacterium]|nr:hypothetical protein [Pseudomonadota bacterium]